MAELIASLLSEPIHRPIEEVIKVDQADERIVRQEIQDYVVTTAISRKLLEVLERYAEAPNRPSDDVGIWVSGFFGSGKSSFAKMLGYAVGDLPVGDRRAAALLAERVSDGRIAQLLRLIPERIPTHTVIFDILTSRGIRASSQPLTEIMYQKLLVSLGYAKSIDLAELEISLERDGRLEAFRQAFCELYDGKAWDDQKAMVSFAFGQAARVLHHLDPETWPQPDSWVHAARGRAELTANLLAERCLELVERRRPGHSILFVVDEVGQFVAQDKDKIQELQGITEALGKKGRGRAWLVVTSQERLNEVVSSIHEKRIELARLLDRFAVQVHLETSDISEVTQRRLLRKTAAAQRSLRELFETWRGRLVGCLRIEGGVPLPEADTEGFINLYPLLPYQIELAIRIVSGLRTQGGASQHIGGANRTIIKLTHGLLIDPRVGLGEASVGRLVTLDRVYDLVQNNIPSDIRAKIDKVPQAVAPARAALATALAKAICLLQYAVSVPTTDTNLAAVLHPSVDAESRLSEVRDVLAQMLDRQLIRDGGHGVYRIPTPAEDDWERGRAAISAAGHVPGVIREALKSLWEPQPQHALLGIKSFGGGLQIDGRDTLAGDIPFRLETADAGAAYDAVLEELRVRSQRETVAVFWALAIGAEIQRDAEELWRSRQIIKERRDAPDTGPLLREEQRRLERSQSELRRRLKQAALSGQAFFRGNDRSPSERYTDVSKAASDILGRVLPEVFDRFAEAGARITQGDIDALLKADSLHGLPAVFTRLHLLKDEQGVPVFDTDRGPLHEVMARIQHRVSFGDIASGKFLESDFAKEPFGWGLDAVRLFTLCLLRAGRIEMTSQGRTIDNPLSVTVQEAFRNNNHFRAAAFRPKAGLEAEDIIGAAAHLETQFGERARELSQASVAAAIRRRFDGDEPVLQEQYERLMRHSLPGVSVLRDGLEQLRALSRDSDAQTILGFNAGYMTLFEAGRRAHDLAALLTDVGLNVMREAREALGALWPEIEAEPEIDEDLPAAADELADLLQREDFFRDITRIELLSRRLMVAHQDVWGVAHAEAVQAYTSALARLEAHPEFPRLSEADKDRVARPLILRHEFEPGTPIAHLRAEQAAAETRLAQAVAEMLRILEGDRLATLDADDYFSTGIETEAELEAALDALRTDCARLLLEGRKVFVR